MGKKGQSPRVKTGGVKSAAELLNWFEKDEGKELLKKASRKEIRNLVDPFVKECFDLKTWLGLVQVIFPRLQKKWIKMI